MHGRVTVTSVLCTLHRFIVIRGALISFLGPVWDFKDGVLARVACTLRAIHVKRKHSSRKQHVAASRCVYPTGTESQLFANGISGNDRCSRRWSRVCTVKDTGNSSGMSYTVSRFVLASRTDGCVPAPQRRSLDPVH